MALTQGSLGLGSQAAANAAVQASRGLGSQAALTGPSAGGGAPRVPRSIDMDDLVGMPTPGGPAIPPKATKKAQHKSGRHPKAAAPKAPAFKGGKIPGTGF